MIPGWGNGLNGNISMCRRPEKRESLEYRATYSSSISCSWQEPDIFQHLPPSERLLRNPPNGVFGLCQEQSPAPPPKSCVCARACVFA